MGETTWGHIKMLVGAALAFLTSVTLNEWVGVATLVYFVLQIGLLLPKYKTVQRLLAWFSRK